jgi:cytoskeleton-associated protein 5
LFGPDLGLAFVRQSWKARLSAYTELIATFKDASDSTFRPYISNTELLKGFVRDSNAVAQEKGVEAAISFLEGGGKQTAK